MEREVITLKTYKELKDNFYEEVGKIDVSKLTLDGIGNTYKDYAELLIKMAELERNHWIDELSGFNPNGFRVSTPKVESEGK